MAFEYTEKWLEVLIREIEEKDTTHDEKRKVTKMCKFKVGDIVRIKPADEMWKSDYTTKSLEKYACTQHRINTIRVIGETPFYLLDDCYNISFDETMLENRVYAEDDIFNINVIVPDKVVEIEFYDGKEKMVCHKDDTFDLRKCCFIAIAKHLYKREYTYEGIEYMAEQLMYQKKYVKIVDRAMKEYQKSEEEKAKKIREEEEEKIVRARQRAKRWKKKQRRIELQEAERNEALKAEREEMVSMMAEAINRAKDDRKKKKFLK